jgi:uncharacterized protein involved in type VI secretion and phage assembly
MSQPFHGKFRGVVTDIQDPLNQGRIRARVPDVLGNEESGWAMPCVPFAGQSMGFFALPKVGGGVWVEFEQGDPDYPIWVGCWWGSASELPAVLLAPPYKKVLIKTEGGHSIVLDDTPGVGGILLETSTGKIKLTGPQVSVNDGALEVV